MPDPIPVTLPPTQPLTTQPVGVTPASEDVGTAYVGRLTDPWTVTPDSTVFEASPMSITLPAGSYQLYLVMAHDVGGVSAIKYALTADAPVSQVAPMPLIGIDSSNARSLQGPLTLEADVLAPSGTANLVFSAGFSLSGSTVIHVTEQTTVTLWVAQNATDPDEAELAEGSCLWAFKTA